MSSKQSILVQLDTDTHPSVFDRVVAIDAGVAHLFSYGGVRPNDVMPLIHGCIFTRGPKDLHRTAVFIGGSDVSAGEALLTEARKHLIPAYGLTVSLMLDSNGANTTAVAAVRSVRRSIDLRGTRCLVLGATGPVGQRVVRLLAKEGAIVRVGSRQRERAEAVCRGLRQHYPQVQLEAVPTATSADAPAALAGQEVVIAAGGPGVVLLPRKVFEAAKSLKVAVDLNGVPPAGIEGIEPADQATERNGIACYGALGVGGLKMKVHKAAINELFHANHLILDADEIHSLAVRLNL
jgi:hypothetical protein